MICLIVWREIIVLVLDWTFHIDFFILSLFKNNFFKIQNFKLILIFLTIRTDKFVLWGFGVLGSNTKLNE